jgi:hypothetical protein
LKHCHKDKIGTVPVQDRVVNVHKSLFCFVSLRRSATVEQREETTAAAATAAAATATAAAAAGLTQEEIT